MKRALICGVSGQDGALLAKHLLDAGYHVWGTTRDPLIASRAGPLAQLDLLDRVSFRIGSFEDLSFAEQCFTELQPDEIYLLSGQSSVGISFSEPRLTLNSVVLATVNALDTLRIHCKDAKLFHASSSECFGDLAGIPANELTPFNPKSPYAVAKVAAHNIVKNYRDVFGVFACNGILFNHESVFRPSTFVSQKIVQGAIEIAAGRSDHLELGDLQITRDWGWAPEFVDAMNRILKEETPRDFVIATGQQYRLEQFVECAFTHVGLDSTKYVRVTDKFSRPHDLAWTGGDPRQAKEVLGWEASVSMPGVISRMMEFSLNSNRRDA